MGEKNLKNIVFIFPHQINLVYVLRQFVLQSGQVFFLDSLLYSRFLVVLVVFLTFAGKIKKTCKSDQSQKLT